MRASGLVAGFWFCLAISLISLRAQADTLTWNFTDQNGVFDGGTHNNFSLTAWAIGNSLGSVGAPFSATSPSTGYAGSTGSGNIGNAVRLGTIDPATSSYFTITLTPDAGYSLTISDLDFGTRSTNTGPQSYSLRYSTNGFSSSTQLTTGTIANDSVWTLKNNTFTAATVNTAVILRIYVGDGTGTPSSGTITSRLDDIKLVATANLLPPAVPTPSAAGGGLALFACIALGRWRFVCNA